MQYHELLVKFRTRAQTIKEILHVRAGSIIIRLHFNRQLDDIEWFWAFIIAGRLPALSTSLANDHGQCRKHLIQLHGFLPDPIILTRAYLLPQSIGVDLLRALLE